MHYTGVSLFGAVPSFGDDKIIIGEVIAAGGGKMTVVVDGGHQAWQWAYYNLFGRSPESRMRDIALTPAGLTEKKGQPSD